MTSVESNAAEPLIEEQQPSWERIYARSGAVQINPLPSISELLKLLPRDASGLQILDAGCGTGRHTLYLASRLPRSRLTAFDVAPTALQRLRQDWQSLAPFSVLRTGVGDIDDRLFRPQISDRKYDIIVCTLVIHHGTWSQIVERKTWLAGLLKPGGLFAFTAPSRRDPRYWTGEAIERGTKINTAQDDGDIPHHFFRRSELYRLFHDFTVLHLSHHRRAMVTAKGSAAQWELVAIKEQ